MFQYKEILGNEKLFNEGFGDCRSAYRESSHLHCAQGSTKVGTLIYE
jgi:hypothetical protein